MEAKRDPRVHAAHGPVVLRPRAAPATGDCLNPDIILVGPTNGVLQGTEAHVWRMTPGTGFPLITATWAEELGLWVAAGRKHVLVSPDGCAWQPVYLDVDTVDYNRVRWNGSLFVVVGSGGRIFTSPDGITWTSRTSGVTDSLAYVRWDAGLGLWLVTGSANRVLTSPDGITWTVFAGPAAGATVTSIVYAPATARYYVVHGSASVAWSADLVAWTLLGNLQATSNKGRITGDGDDLIIPCTGGNIVQSVDGGANWTKTKITPAGSNASFTDAVKTSTGLWVVGGAQTSNDAMAVWTSPDFAAWTGRATMMTVAVTSSFVPGDLAAK